MSKLTEFLKDTPELNLSALSRAADIKGTKLQQSVKGIEHKPGYIRRLTEEEEKRVWQALELLAQKITAK